MDGMRHVPVDREAPAAAYLAARRLLREGEAVCVFPEAGISWSYAVRALMRGPAALARETGAPLVPVALWGTQRIWSVGRPVGGRKPRPSLRRHRPVDVAFGEPMTVLPGDDLVEAIGRLGHALTDLVEGLQRHPTTCRDGGDRAVVPRAPRRARPGPGRGAGTSTTCRGPPSRRPGARLRRAREASGAAVGRSVCPAWGTTA